MATVTVDPNTSYQTFIAWQASGETGIGDYVASGPSWNDAVLDANVDLGINQVRIGIMSGLAENSTDYYQAFIDGNQDFVDNNTPAEYAAVRNNRRVPVNDNADPNSINASGFKWGHIDWQIDNVVAPMKSKLAARGEDLRWGASYIHFSEINRLHTDTPAEYGELILATWNHINSKYGYVPDFLEIFLEPDNFTDDITATELADMIVSARDKLVNAGYSKPYIVCPSTTAGVNGRAFYLNIKSVNATAAGYIDGIGYHLYQDMDAIQRGDLSTTAIADGKNTEMTEFGGGTIANLHEDLKTAKVSVWEQYALGYPSFGGVTDNGYQHFLVGAGPSYTLTQANRTKYLRPYMTPIRRNAVRKGASITGTGSANGDPLAFRNANGTYAVIVKTSGAVDFDIAGLPDGTYKVRRVIGNGTSAPSLDWDDPGDEVVSGGNTGIISMSGAGVATIYNENFLPNVDLIKGGRGAKRQLFS